jgi:hypothetical protein
MTKPGDHSPGEQALQELVGEQLSSVTFVMDYLQLAFDGPTINAYTWPTVGVAEEVLRFGNPGYRDALCARIAVKVVSVRLPPDRIEIAFADGSMICISLRADDLTAGNQEVAEFRGSQWMTFRPD